MKTSQSTKLRGSPLLISILIISQFCFGLNCAFADSIIEGANVTPEETLIQEAIVLQGSHLPQNELQNQLTAAISDYEAKAPVENREQRLEQAIVAMNMMTPQQAANLTQQVSADLGKNAATPDLELQNPLMTSASGAQFSACTVAGAVFVAAWAGAMGIVLSAHSIAPPTVLKDGQVIDHDQSLIEASIGLIIAGLVVGAAALVNGC